VRSLDKVFAGLASSSFRRSFRLSDRERRYLQDRGMETILLHARTFIDQRLAPEYPARDGKQTPYHGHPAFVAQHATATCCRSCLEKWHGIPKGHRLSEQECEHVLATLERWLREAGGWSSSGRQRANPESAT
jgi:hypothetical protein